ncbi:hypothetical protein QE152_g13250 [Popillia japonica]|uniref:Uncharacterized protein n=1 Tax=Popillia japonica TaxID=7064 RepID=A0AAW1LCT8_POPJA
MPITDHNKRKNANYRPQFTGNRRTIYRYYMNLQIYAFSFFNEDRSLDRSAIALDDKTSWGNFKRCKVTLQGYFKASPVNLLTSLQNNCAKEKLFELKVLSPALSSGLVAKILTLTNLQACNKTGFTHHKVILK